VSFFCEPLFAAHDRDQVEVYCYSDVAVADQVTQRIKSAADSWCDCLGLTDEVLAQRIRGDRIDLLVDLSGHTAMNRLSLFARKPAPVQVSWLGYPGTTGLQAMDYRLTDAVADPEGEADRCHSEELYRLPGGFLCYAPPRAAPRVTGLPLAGNGFVTFGSFNNLPKLTAEVLELWAELLRQLPRARLLLKNKFFANALIRQRMLESFGRLGITAERISVLPAEPSIQAHLECYGKVDISLDPFPYNGTTTTFESLWMGVPTVTLSGERHAGRVGTSILTALGLTGHIAATPQQYLDIARGLAGDAAGLAALRSSLRDRLAGSQLCDAQLFAGKVEAAYRLMWQRHCAAGAGTGP
jgi:protein O-GlcNAc transferase